MELLIIIPGLFVSSFASHEINFVTSWWRHQMETFSALLALCAAYWPFLRGINWSPVNANVVYPRFKWNYWSSSPACLSRLSHHMKLILLRHDDVIKWKHFPRYWPFVRLTGHFCGVLTGHQWIPLTKVSDTELWYISWCPPERTVDQTIETRMIWDPIELILSSL